MKARSAIAALLEKAGISINGINPWDPHAHDGRLFRRVLRERTLGAGEAYMDA